MLVGPVILVLCYIRRAASNVLCKPRWFCACFWRAASNVLCKPCWYGTYFRRAASKVLSKSGCLVPVLGVRPRLQMYCVNRAVPVPALGVRPRLQMYCANRAVFVPLWGVQLQMYCVNRGVTFIKATPYHLLSFVRLGHFLSQDTDTPYHGHYQPRHQPHAIVGFDYNHHGDLV